MSIDTSLVNRHRQDFSQQQSVWLFGYGSLIYKADFPFLERRPARVRGWARRFWQGSHDHRGTPEHPGRVATLIRQKQAECVGMAYRIAPTTFTQLDLRERNGYLRFTTPLLFEDGGREQAVVYIATADNAAWQGESSEEELVATIARSRGCSGPNSEYLLKLAQSLRELGTHDAHVFALEACLKRRLGPSQGAAESASA